MTTSEYQEMQRLEGDLSPSVLFSLKRESATWDDYLRRLREYHARLTEAIAKLDQEIRSA